MPQESFAGFYLIDILVSLYKARIEAGDDPDKALSVVAQHTSIQIALTVQKQAAQELEKKD